MLIVAATMCTLRSQISMVNNIANTAFVVRRVSLR